MNTKAGENLKIPIPLQKLIQHLKKLPGVGSKSAERFAFELLNWTSKDLTCFSETLFNLHTLIQNCSICGCIQEKDRCFFCSNEQRDANILCIVSNPKDVFAIEKTRSYQGVYHVFSQVFSPMDHSYLDPAQLEKLIQRINSLKVKEVLLALDSTLNGDATSLYIKQRIEHMPLKISRLAFGVPLGSSLEFIDEGTLARALTGRQNF